MHCVRLSSQQPALARVESGADGLPAEHPTTPVAGARQAWSVRNIEQSKINCDIASVSIASAYTEPLHGFQQGDRGLAVAEGCGSRCGLRLR